MSIDYDFYIYCDKSHTKSLPPAIVPRCVGAAALNILDFYEHFLTVPSLRHCRQLLLQECRSIQIYLDQYDNSTIITVFELGLFLKSCFIEEISKSIASMVFFYRNMVLIV